MLSDNANRYCLKHGRQIRRKDEQKKKMNIECAKSR